MKRAGSHSKTQQSISNNYSIFLCIYFVVVEYIVNVIIWSQKIKAIKLITVITLGPLN